MVAMRWGIAVAAALVLAGCSSTASGPASLAPLSTLLLTPADAGSGWTTDTSGGSVDRVATCLTDLIKPQEGSSENATAALVGPGPFPRVEEILTRYRDDANASRAVSVAMAVAEDCHGAVPTSSETMIDWVESPTDGARYRGVGQFVDLQSTEAAIALTVFRSGPTVAVLTVYDLHLNNVTLGALSNAANAKLGAGEHTARV